MTTINIHEAKTHLSRLIEEALHGKPFIIAKAGKPLVKVTALDPQESEKVRRLGFLKGQFKIPEDFNKLGREEIAAMFSADK